MNKNYLKYYLFSLMTLLLASIYPIYMGAITASSYMQKGFIDVKDYQKYIIPYTPICIALIVITILMPLIFKLCKKYCLLVASVLGTGLFFIAEFGFEQIKVLEGYKSLPIESWQYSLCISTPEVLKSIGEPIYAQNNPAFKIHFYIIAVVIILAVINVIYGFLKMILEKSYDKKLPLTVQLVSLLIFLGLCILACFTGFYRKGTLDISVLSASLMSVFFIVFGATLGVYFGCIFYGKKKLLSVIVPAIVSTLTTIVMYVGELILMGGVLFKFGSGFIFEPIGLLPFALSDFAVIIFSGLITYFVMKMINRGVQSKSK